MVVLVGLVTTTLVDAVLEERLGGEAFKEPPTAEEDAEVDGEERKRLADPDSRGAAAELVTILTEGTVIGGAVVGSTAGGGNLNLPDANPDGRAELPKPIDRPPGAADTGGTVDDGCDAVVAEVVTASVDEDLEKP